MLLILRCWQWAVTREGRMRGGMQGERREGETNSNAGENRYEAYTCVHVPCAYVDASGCIIIYVQCMVRCTSWGWATAVDSAHMRCKSEKQKNPAREANIKEGTGVTLLLWQILYKLITYHSNDTRKSITRVHSFLMTKFIVWTRLLITPPVPKHQRLLSENN